MEDWINLISNVGYPIAMSLIIYYTLLNMILKKLDSIEEKIDEHISKS